MPSLGPIPKASYFVGLGLEPLGPKWANWDELLILLGLEMVSFQKFPSEAVTAGPRTAL